MGMGRVGVSLALLHNDYDVDSGPMVGLLVGAYCICLASRATCTANCSLTYMPM